MQGLPKYLVAIDHSKYDGDILLQGYPQNGGSKVITYIGTEWWTRSSNSADSSGQSCPKFGDH